MKKLLIICGPTATGKTKLGLHLAQKYNGEIISADSRQVFKSMDIGTGKGLSPDSNFEFRVSNLSWQDQPLGYYQNDLAKIWAYDLVDPHQEFSVAHYRQIALAITQDIYSRHQLPILVGGTGFYIDALVNPPETINTPINTQLRDQLNQLSLNKLQQKLTQLNPDKFISMNHSDQRNPRRLVRAIEVASSNNPGVKHPGVNNFDTLWLGLKSSLDQLKKSVTQNVLARATHSFTQEIQHLDSLEFDWSSPAATATGYQEWKAFLDNKISKQEAIDQWVTREHQYQKRQLTWFNSREQINWFDHTDQDLFSQVEDLVNPWYS